jgi:hypothetical protein
LDASGNVYRRKETSQDNAMGCEWERLSGIPGGFKYISGAELNLVYAISTNDDSMWYLAPGVIWKKPENSDFDWTLVPGDLMTTLDVGRNGKVVGSDENGKVFFRAGITKATVIGTSWSPLQSDDMSQVAMCSSGVFLGLGAANGRIYARNNVNDDTPSGDSWTQLEVFQQSQDGFKQISCGYRDMILAVTGGKAYYRTGYTAQQPLGTGWEEFTLNGLDSGDQTFTHISVGDDGKIWAVVGGNVVVRDGEFPAGTGWRYPANGGKMTQVEVGKSSVWGINKWNEIWYR